MNSNEQCKSNSRAIVVLLCSINWLPLDWLALGRHLPANGLVLESQFSLGSVEASKSSRGVNDKGELCSLTWPRLSRGALNNKIYI